MALRYNPATNRWETNSGVDSPPTGTVEMQFYVDQKTGQYKQRQYNNGLGQPDPVVSTVIVPANKRNIKPSYEPVMPVTGGTPNVNWTPPKGTAQTVKQTKPPKGSASSTKIPSAPFTIPDGDYGWENTPVGGTYVDTRSGISKVRKPNPNPDIISPSAGNIRRAEGFNATTPKSGPSAGEFRRMEEKTKIVDGVDITKADRFVTDYVTRLAQDPAALIEAINDGTLARILDPTASTGGGGGSAAATAAAKLKAQKQAGKKIVGTAKNAQKQYETMGQTTYDDILKRAGTYYDDKKKQALSTIDAATADYLKNMIAPTAYQNLVVPEFRPEQQGLLESLKAYGATGGQAAQQMQEDVANNRFLADLMRSSAKGLQSADVDYFNALKNAAIGGQTAARQNLESIISNYQGQAQTDAERLKREYIAKGLEALISGQTNAANLLA